MEINWKLYKALEGIDDEKSKGYATQSIDNMNEYLEKYTTTSDKENVKMNHPTVYEILIYNTES